eukprot:TRINITY_DN2089_c0_g1_i8.p1 TRINITY_DN2089_c0_g1~~TRINITY_DN2089_c0_g1_i8.p1  ORF type:complete len:819 (+),score=170.28 TRINITY_DN2089_c0_g1_i8:215-2671(+)
MSSFRNLLKSFESTDTTTSSENAPASRGRRAQPPLKRHASSPQKQQGSRSPLSPKNLNIQSQGEKNQHPKPPSKGPLFQGTNRATARPGSPISRRQQSRPNRNSENEPNSQTHSSSNKRPVPAVAMTVNPLHNKTMALKKLNGGSPRSSYKSTPTKRSRPLPTTNQVAPAPPRPSGPPPKPKHTESTPSLCQRTRSNTVTASKQKPHAGDLSPKAIPMKRSSATPRKGTTSNAGTQKMTPSRKTTQRNTISKIHYQQAPPPPSLTLPASLSSSSSSTPVGAKSSAGPSRIFAMINLLQSTDDDVVVDGLNQISSSCKHSKSAPGDVEKLGEIIPFLIDLHSRWMSEGAMKGAKLARDTMVAISPDRTLSRLVGIIRETESASIAFEKNRKNAAPPTSNPDDADGDDKGKKLPLSPTEHRRFVSGILSSIAMSAASGSALVQALRVAAPTLLLLLKDVDPTVVSNVDATLSGLGVDASSFDSMVVCGSADQTTTVGGGPTSASTEEMLSRSRSLSSSSLPSLGPDAKFTSSTSSAQFFNSDGSSGMDVDDAMQRDSNTPSCFISVVGEETQIKKNVQLSQVIHLLRSRDLVKMEEALTAVIYLGVLAARQICIREDGRERTMYMKDVLMSVVVNEKSASIRILALKALLEIGPSAIGALPELQEVATRDKDEAVRAAAMSTSRKIMTNGASSDAEIMAQFSKCPSTPGSSSSSSSSSSSHIESGTASLSRKHGRSFANKRRSQYNMGGIKAVEIAIQDAIEQMCGASGHGMPEQAIIDFILNKSSGSKKTAGFTKEDIRYVAGTNLCIAYRLKAVDAPP